MNCLKCGREVGNKEIFCPACQEDMAKHPVKPGTAVYIPTRTDAPAPKPHPKKKLLTLEQQVKNLKTANHRLIATVIILVLLIMVMLGLFQTGLQKAYEFIPKGQNYSAETNPQGGR